MNIAHRAAEILDERGRCRGEVLNEAGEMCLNGALMSALFEKHHGRLPLTEDELYGFAGGPFGYGQQSNQPEFDHADQISRSLLGTIPWCWNDRPSTSDEDVVVHLKRIGEVLDSDA